MGLFRYYSHSPCAIQTANWPEITLSWGPNGTGSWNSFKCLKQFEQMFLNKEKLLNIKPNSQKGEMIGCENQSNSNLEKQKQ